MNVLDEFVLENELDDFLIRCSLSIFLESVVDKDQEAF